MAKAPQPLAERGADHPQQLYELVGVALSWWEASEDMILGLFRHLCAEIEPVAMESFIQAPRNVRYSMLKLAMQTYKFLMLESDINKVERALKELDKLASTRNEIAHGHVSSFNSTVDGKQTATGNYLLPSLNEGTFHERGFRFHHTPATLNQFVADVRRWRGDVYDAHFAVLQETQKRRRFGMDDLTFFQLARRIASLEIPGREALDRMTELVSHIASYKDGS